MGEGRRRPAPTQSRQMPSLRCLIGSPALPDASVEWSLAFRKDKYAASLTAARGTQDSIARGGWDDTRQKPPDTAAATSAMASPRNSPCCAGPHGLYRPGSTPQHDGTTPGAASRGDALGTVRDPGALLVR